MEKFVVECCLKLFERLECRDYCRFDWWLDSKGNPKLLEVNPNPGWCWDGHLAKMAKFADISYSEMLAAILRAAEERLGIQPAARKLNSQIPINVINVKYIVNGKQPANGFQLINGKTCRA